MRLKFLLTPGWIALILCGLVFSALCFSVLAPWQFRRDAERTVANSAIQASFTAQPLPLPQVLGPGQAPDGHIEFRTVTLTGDYLPGGELVARLREVLTQPAYEVLTPFRLTDGTVALVDRGYVSPTDGTRAPAFAPPPSGQVTVTARIRQDEVDPKHRDAMLLDGRRQVYTIDSRVVGRADGLTLRPGYVELTAGQPGVLAALPLPDLNPGPFFAYAVQWLIFGAFAIIGIGYLIWRELHPESDEVDIAEFDDLAEFADEDDVRDTDTARAAATGSAAARSAAARTGAAGPVTDTANSDSAAAGTAPGATESRERDAEDHAGGEDASAAAAPPAGSTGTGSAGARPAPPLVPADRYGRRR